MDYKKIRQENASFLILLFVVIGIFVASFMYIRQGIVDDKMYYTIGGAVFAFISFYGIVVFLKRLYKVSFARKVGDVMLYDRMRSVKQIADKLDKTSEKVSYAISFLINNDYIKGFKLDGDLIINSTEEKMRRAQIEEKLDSIRKNVTEIARDYTSTIRKQKNKHSGRCKGCGAVMVFSDTQAICPYCGNLIKAE